MFAYCIFFFLPDGEIHTKSDYMFTSLKDAQRARNKFVKKMKEKKDLTVKGQINRKMKIPHRNREGKITFYELSTHTTVNVGVKKKKTKMTKRSE